MRRFGKRVLYETLVCSSPTYRLCLIRTTYLPSTSRHSRLAIPIRRLTTGQIKNERKEMREEARRLADFAIDRLEMAVFNQGFEAAMNGLDEISNTKHNEGDTIAAEVLRWAVKELRGENLDS